MYFNNSINSKTVNVNLKNSEENVGRVVLQITGRQ